MENNKKWEAYTNEQGKKCIGIIPKNAVTIHPGDRYEINLEDGEISRIGSGEKPDVEINKKKKRKDIAGLLAFFLGGLGIHKFYLGDNKTGLLYLLFCWTYVPAILGLIDTFIIASMSEDKFDEKYN